MHVQEDEGPLNSVPSFCREPGNPAKGQAGPAGSGGRGWAAATPSDGLWIPAAGEEAGGWAAVKSTPAASPRVW